MKRRISLYIGNHLMDLDEQSFILFNHTMDDLSNPTIVKNSFSKQITLKGTPNNNAVFGYLFRLDRIVSAKGGDTGASFSSNRKVSFAIYNELNEILESGYIKMDSITRNGADIEYKITLYGGLGSFLYSLAYDEQGNKKSLADLDYLNTGSSETELDFTINADAVRAAWAELQVETPSGLWSIINFAPAYEGIPQSGFSADKAVVAPGNVGLASTFTDEDGNVYSDKNGNVLVNLAQEQDQWSVKDLRSYLQRPVLSMRAFFNAICNPANNGGYSVDISALDFPYMDTWKTLPLLPSMKALRKTSGDLTLTLDATPVATGTEIGRFVVGGTIPSGATMSSVLNIKMQSEVTYTDGADSLLTMHLAEGGGVKSYDFCVMFAQAVAYGADNSIVGGSKVLPLYSWRYTSPEDMAQFCSFTPVVTMEDQYEERADLGNFELVDGITYQIPNEMTLSVNASDYSSIAIVISSYNVRGVVQYTRNGSIIYLDELMSSNDAFPMPYDAEGNTYMLDNSVAIETDNPSTIAISSSASSIRSNALVGKRDILSTSYTPADCLVSFCKKFGLYFLCDNATKSITILRRNDLYVDETIDLSRRIDLSKPISINPYAYDARWYDFNLKGIGGEYADEYASLYGREYGIQRVNTGYPFDANSVDLLSGNAFKGAVSVLESSRYFNTITEGGSFRPSVFVDKGNTYTLWTADGNTIERGISSPLTSANVDYFNDVQGYDYNGGQRLQIHDASGKNLNGEDVLVFLNGFVTYPYFKISDDSAAMTALNEGVPCYDLEPGTAEGVSVPSFSRYQYEDGRIIRSLDFGIPAEVDMPSVTHDENAGVYAKAWRAYMTDRYNENTKVMICHVNLEGLQVSQSLLRKFYWYENSIWVLNKIVNHSITTWDSTECEFVQVQKKENYTNGQNE